MKLTYSTAYRYERRVLQLIVCLAACVPVFAGIMGMLKGVSMFDISGAVSLDSHLRYLSGLLCGLGICFWSIVPTIERQTLIVRALTVMIFLGGCARLTAAIFIATPSLPMLLAIGMELIVTPALCFWQTRIAHLSAANREKPPAM